MEKDEEGKGNEANWTGDLEKREVIDSLTKTELLKLKQTSKRWAENEKIDKTIKVLHQWKKTIWEYELREFNETRSELENTIEARVRGWIEQGLYGGYGYWMSEWIRRKRSIGSSTGLVWYEVLPTGFWHDR